MDGGALVPMVAAPAWTDKILSASKRLALEEWLGELAKEIRE